MSGKFNKKERLTGVKKINDLFTGGHSFVIHPFRVIWLPGEERSFYPARILISIPKRFHKKAVTRNQLKRRIREAYRLNKDDFLNELRSSGQSIDFGLLYISREVMDYQRIEQKIILILQRLISKGE